MVSSPDVSGGLLETIEKDWNSKDKKLLLDYTYGLDNIHNREEMKMKTLEPEFRRECMGYNHTKSNLSATQIDDCIQTRRTTKEHSISNYNAHSVGVEFGFSRSRTIIVMTQHLKGDVNVIIVRFSAEYDKSNPQEIGNICHSLYRKYWNTWFWVDGFNRAAVNLT